jgi:lysophospholipase L1-like esterase
LLFRALTAFSMLLLPALAHAAPPTVSGFGDSITCIPCNDGSYLGLLGDYLVEPPIVEDNGVWADLTDGVLFRFDAWLTGGNSADVVVILTGTPDTYQAVGGFNNRDYSEAESVGNVADILDLADAAGLPAILVAPPPVLDPCGFPTVLTCSEIAVRLADLSVALQALAVSRGVPFVDLNDAFANHPGFLFTPGDPLSLFRPDGLHPKLDPGDDLIAQEVANAIAALPEEIPALPPLGLAGLASALLGLARSRACRARRLRVRLQPVEDLLEDQLVGG